MLVENGVLKKIYAEDIINGEFNNWDGITSIGKNAFKWIKGLERIRIPSTIKNIEIGAFELCRDLEEVIIEDGVNIVEAKAFCECEKLERVRLPNTLKKLEDRVFEGCLKLIEIEIPDSVVVIGVKAFYNCEALETVTLPKYLEKIDDVAFGNCEKIANIDIPKTVKSIGSLVFNNCISLKRIEIPEGIEEIKEFTFSFCEKLESVTLPSTIRRLGESAFAECGRLKSINLPNKLESIGTFCFTTCEGLTNVVIPSNVKKIESYAFENCVNLTSFVLPPNLEVVGESIFYNCEFLEKIKIGEQEYNYQEYKKVLLFSDDDFYIFGDGQKSSNSVLNLILYIDKKKIDICSVKYPDSFLVMLDKERLIKIFEYDSYKHFKDVYKHYERELKEANDYNVVAFYKFAYYLGCFSNEEVVIGGRKINVAQKASVCLRALLDNYRLSIGRCDGLFRWLKLQNNNVDFLKFVSDSMDNFMYLVELGDRMSKVMNEFDNIMYKQTIIDSKGREIVNPSVKRKIYNYITEITYGKVKPGNEDLVEEFMKFLSIEQVNLTEAQDIREKGKDTPSHILGKELKETPISRRIEKLKEEINENCLEAKKAMDEVYEKEFTYEWLDKRDAKNFTLGIYCNCCASILSCCYGFNLMEDSIVREDCQNLVIRDKEGEIIAKATIYVNKEKGYAVFNDIEMNRKYGDESSEDDESDDKQRKEIYNTFKRGANDFVREYNKINEIPIKQVNVGWGFNKLKQIIREMETKSEELLESLPSFKDARSEQWVIYKKESNGRGF